MRHCLIWLQEFTVKFHQDTMTHILMTIMNVISKRSVVLPYLKPDKKRQKVHKNMTMI